MSKPTKFFIYLLLLIAIAKIELINKSFAQEEEILGNRCRDTKYDIVSFFDIKNKDTVFYRKIYSDVPVIAVFVKAKAGDDFFPVQSIIFKDSATNQVMQIIDSDSDSIAILNIEFDDYNFDGYTDIYVYDGCAILANCFGKVFIYDKNKNKFVRDYAFDDMTSIQADKEKKEILSFNQCCAGAESESRTYKYFDGKLTMVKEILKSYDNEKAKFRYIIKEYDDKGNLVNSKEIISDKYELDE